LRPYAAGAINGSRFEDWFESSLSKPVEKGKTAIMDKVSFHRKKQLEEICKEYEVSLFSMRQV
jgi:hypothetical protein